MPAILFHNTMRVNGGALSEFEAAIHDAVRFVERHGPQLMVQIFLDHQHMLAHSYQLYRDSESILTHWRLSDPYIQEVMRHCTVQRLDVCGQPNETVMERLRSLLPDNGITLTTTPHLAGFTRLPAAYQSPP